MNKSEDIKLKLGKLRDEVREHANEAEDPKCAVLCETTAEVLTGLETAYDHYLNKSEKAWQ
jgi:hypothetical protein